MNTHHSSDEGAVHAPNHHASHPGFSGASGLLAAVSFLFGRDTAADLAVELAALQPGATLVDIGCGPGVAVQRARAAGATVIGVDPAPVMLRVARTRWRAADKVQWRIGTAEALPVDDQWAQVVWSLSTVHHWHDVDRSLAEARRVLAPGGRLVVLERHIPDPGAKGSAGHGWARQQADEFAAQCTTHGFVNARVGEHRGNGPVLSVVADVSS